MTKISNDLQTAYEGYYEGHYDDKGMFYTPETLIAKIQKDSPKERLMVYCEENGIIGYSNRLFEIATGEL